jgi:hypothetical protein
MAIANDLPGWQARLLEQGRIHYASGRFFTALEIWAVGWRDGSGTPRLLLQGLILAAGAYQKMAAGQPVGMALLLERSLERLQFLPDGLAGLQIERFRQGLRGSLLEAWDWQEGAPPPSGAAPLAAWSGPLPEIDDAHLGA